MRTFYFSLGEITGQPVVPYFQYKIGPFQNDYFLYFRREPNWPRYKYEIFSKLYTLSGYDIPRYLDFHYSAYADKEGFRRFLKFEIEDRVAVRGSKAMVQKLQIVSTWVAEQEKLEAAKTAVTNVTPVNGNGLELIEEHMAELKRSFDGKIVINGSHQLEKLIQLLILVKDLRAPGKTGAPLFSSFSTTDMAAILRQLDELGDLKLNTLQKKITEGNMALRINAKAAALEEALIKFFFGS
jgi:hypothetical protein